ncbi:hypothetical protein PR048_020038 [Dryococelus australis]|uniref:Uncharacterized protein n=1 Tax=Dryococelus australis TaxID=614101 RepID=A0ABQ9H5A1_9NEOP|nr:hypothetical protein PR048_020038 [Dryococelus australis]
MKDKEHFDEGFYTKQFIDIYYGVISYLAIIQEEPKRNECAVASLPRHESWVSLPTIHLPLFYGKQTEWINFSNLFSTLVVTNEHLSNVEKQSYLKSSLSAEQLSFIQALPMTADHFVVAWQLLDKRFNNKRFRVSQHVDVMV